MKETNKSIAERTLRIIDEGTYLFGDNNIEVRDQIRKSVNGTFTVSPDEFDALSFETINEQTEIVFKNGTTIEALLDEESGFRTCLLNFASAKNPGGGFLGGASAQEESLARSSSLYASLIKDETMYSYNRGRSTYLYSDYMIYSPEVQFWMNDEGESLPKPSVADVLTAPAPNKGAMLQNNRPEQILELEKVFRIRMDKMFRLAASQKAECLVLGAWGCGVFRNEPEFVAACFEELLATTYKNVFRKVVFAVYDRSKTKSSYTAFKNAFEKQTELNHES